jgi:RHH-type rel operon transcriptional repressor/antitoxin RelB
MATSLTLPTVLEKRLDSLAEKTGRTKSFYLRKLILFGLDEIEDLYESIQVVQEIQQGKTNVISLEETNKLNV